MKPRANAVLLWGVVSVAIHGVAFMLLPRRQVPRFDSEVIQVTLERRVAPEAPPLPMAANKGHSQGQRRARAPAPRVREVPAPALSSVAPARLQRRESSAPEPRGNVELPPAVPAEGLNEATPEAAADATRGDRASDAPAIGAASKGHKPAGDRAVPPQFDAAYLRNPPPRYPASARRRGEQGTVTLQVLVTREGSASKVSVATTSGYAALDAAAVDAVSAWRFVPARRGDEPTQAWVLVPIVFRLEAAASTR